MNTPRPRHPAWALVMLLARGAILLAILKYTASNFDMTEWIAIGLFLLGDAGLLGGNNWLGKKG